MKTEDVVNLIQHYRHDILNQIQIVHGYIKLGDFNKADTSMTQLLDYFYQERKLLNLNMPNVLLWFLQYKIRYENFNLMYDIDIENKKLQTADLFIVDKLERIMEDIQRLSKHDKLYQVEIEFKDNIDDCLISVYIDLDANETNGADQTALKDIDINITENEYVYSFYVSVSNEVK